MTYLLAKGERIDPRPNDSGQVGGFVWRGELHRIARVRQRWRVDSDWWSERGAVSREYYAVTTEGGLLCVLFCDAASDAAAFDAASQREWRIARVYD